MFNSKKVENILWFSQITKSDIPSAGGKGANLGELTQAGIPVPPGFVVTAQAYFAFLEESRLVEKIKSLLSGLNPEDTKKLNQAAKQLQATILSAKLSAKLINDIKNSYNKLVKEAGTEYVAVRSSATAEDLPDASFAGQQITLLNTLGADQVVKNVQLCWASLYEPRAIYYRIINNFDHMKVGIAVPVQAMIQSEVSGIMFTIDPVTNNKDVLIIEAGYGLGEAVVSGSVTPDRYIVNKTDLKILDKEINTQTWKIARDKDKGEDIHFSIPEDLQKTQKLPDELVVELAKIGAEVEKHYGSPQDTEWAVVSDKRQVTSDKKNSTCYMLHDKCYMIYIVQSRPVTTLKKELKVSEVDGKKIDEAPTGQPKTEDIILKGAAASVGMASGPVKIIHSPSEIDKIEKGDVLVTEMTTPDFVPAMKRATAIVTDTGGRTCHAAIVSRELGIPCVVGTGTATNVLKQGQMITVDGAKGLVYKGKFTQITNVEPLSTRAQVITRQEVPVTGTKVYVNLAEVELAEKIAQEPVDGVGLLRAEFMIAAMGQHPRLFIKEGRQKEFVEKLADGMRTFAQAFNPRPVIYRATDFKSNEYKNLKGGEEFEPKEENPMIGYRGCFRYLKEPDLFNLELEAIKTVRDKYDLRNLHLMIPFVRRIDDLVHVRELTKKSGLFDSSDFKFWMMAEVPSNVILIDQFLDVGVDGISIGSNDLTQLTLGVDRDSQKLAEEFDERDPAVVESIKHLIQKCRARNVTCSICGQAPSTYPEYTEILVEAGVTSISVNPDMIIPARRLIASIERKIILKKLMK